MSSVPSVCDFTRLSSSREWVTFSSQSHLTTRGQFDRKVIAELFQFCPLRKELCSGTNLVIEVVPEIHYQILHLVIWFVITSRGEEISILLFILLPAYKKNKPYFCWVYPCFLYLHLPFWQFPAYQGLYFSLIINVISQNFYN